MISWFLGQTDYLFFLYGLAFIGLGAVSYLLSRQVNQRLAWIWLALFGFTNGTRPNLILLNLTLPGKNGLPAAVAFGEQVRGAAFD